MAQIAVSEVAQIAVSFHDECFSLLDFHGPDVKVTACVRRGPKPRFPSHAGVAELVDARDSKSRFFGSAGSIPAAGTLNCLWMIYLPVTPNLPITRSLTRCTWAAAKLKSGIRIFRG